MTNFICQLLAHAGESHDSGSFFANLPPVHPILVNFTAALVPVSLGADIMGRLLKRESLRHAGWWTMLLAAVVTPLTVLAGWLWLRDMRDMDGMKEMSIHKWLGTAMAAALPLFAWWRGRFQKRGMSPGWAYLGILSVAMAALTVQGHLGGMMSFGSMTPSSTDGDHSPRPGRSSSRPASQPTMPGEHHHGGGGEPSAGGHDLGNGWKDEIEIK